jgi:hypothetical protein
MSEPHALAPWERALPPALAPYLDALRATVRPCLRLTLSDAAPKLETDSYLAGYDHEDEDGCRFVATFISIRLGQWPALPGLPPVGVLTCNLTDATRPEWRFEPQSSASTVWPEATAGLAGWRKLAIEGRPDDMPILPEDAAFPAAIAAAFEALGDDRWQALADYRKAAGAGGHRLGGYAAFLQDDPRQPQEAADQCLLLQWDADPAHGLYWGDMGRAHWFVQAPPSLTRSIDTIAPAVQLRFHLEMS